MFWRATNSIFCCSAKLIASSDLLFSSADSLTPPLISAFRVTFNLLILASIPALALNNSFSLTEPSLNFD